MIKQLVILATCAISLGANAQLGKLLKKGDSGSEKDASLPKGIEIYTTEHKDDKGISGKYFMKYPIRLITANMMNMEKPFNVNEVTLEVRSDYSGVFHFVNNEPKNKIRYESTDMTKAMDFGWGDMNSEVFKKTIDKCSCYRFMIKNTLMPKTSSQGFSNGALMLVYSKDPDIIIIAKPNIYEYEKKGTKEYFIERGMDFKGGQFNVLSKDKAKLEQWDSTKIANVIWEEYKIFEGKVTSAYGDIAEMPGQAVNDDAREKEYFDLIKPFALKDKPVAWGDRMEYVYIVKDWKVMYRKDNPKVISHRTALIAAVSSGWPNGECRYIYCSINQTWDGTKYGPSFMAGFNQGLIPISCEKVKAFKH